MVDWEDSREASLIAAVREEYPNLPLNMARDTDAYADFLRSRTDNVTHSLKEMGKEVVNDRYTDELQKLRTKAQDLVRKLRNLVGNEEQSVANLLQTASARLKRRSRWRVKEMLEVSADSWKSNDTGYQKKLSEWKSLVGMLEKAVADAAGQNCESESDQKDDGTYGNDVEDIDSVQRPDSCRMS